MQSLCEPYFWQRRPLFLRTWSWIRHNLRFAAETRAFKCVPWLRSGNWPLVSLHLAKREGLSHTSLTIRIFHSRRHLNLLRNCYLGSTWYGDHKCCQQIGISGHFQWFGVYETVHRLAPKAEEETFRHFSPDSIDFRIIWKLTYLFGSSWVQTDSLLNKSGLILSLVTWKVHWPTTWSFRPIKIP